MALDVDGYALLKAVAASPDAFPDIRADAAKAGRDLVVKQLKAKGLALPALRRIRDLVGTESFALIVDGLKESEARSLVGRLDKHHPDAKTATADWLRRRLVGLADREEPAAKAVAAKPPKAPKPAPRPKPAVERALADRPFAATWDGKDHDTPARKKKKG